MAQVLEQALMTVPLHFGGANITGDEDATRLCSSRSPTDVVKETGPGVFDNTPQSIA
jgi:hypothetical protein